MSLKKYIFAGLIGIVSLGSCTYLDKEPDTEIDIDMVFENKTKVESWLANVYSRIPNPGNDWLNTYGWEVFADDLTASARWQQWTGLISLRFLVDGRLIHNGRVISGMVFLGKYARLTYLLSGCMHCLRPICHRKKWII